MHQIACTFFKNFPGLHHLTPFGAGTQNLASSPSKILAARLGLDLCVGANLGFSNVGVRILSGGPKRGLIWGSVMLAFGSSAGVLGCHHRKILKMLCTFWHILGVRNINLDFMEEPLLRVCY